jgi:hypothetical protein
MCAGQREASLDVQINAVEAEPRRERTRAIPKTTVKGKAQSQTAAVQEIRQILKEENP